MRVCLTPEDKQEVNLITFTVGGTTYQAEEGMTWGEWIESEYNTSSICSPCGIQVHTSSGSRGIITDNEGNNVHISTIILDNYCYYADNMSYCWDC